MTCELLVPWPGIELVPHAVEIWVLIHHQGRSLENPSNRTFCVTTNHLRGTLLGKPTPQFITLSGCQWPLCLLTAGGLPRAKAIKEPPCREWSQGPWAGAYRREKLCCGGTGPGPTDHTAAVAFGAPAACLPPHRPSPATSACYAH